KYLELMLGLRKGGSYSNAPAHHGVDLGRPNPRKLARDAAANDSAVWTPPVLSSIAREEKGIAELVDALDRHFAYLERTGHLAERRRERTRERVRELVEQRFSERLWSDSGTVAALEQMIPDIESRATTPFGAADRILRSSA